MKGKSKKISQKAVEKINKTNEEISEIWDGFNTTTNTDVLGSYTGNPKNFDQPEQDPDDL